MKAGSSRYFNAGRGGRAGWTCSVTTATNGSPAGLADDAAGAGLGGDFLSGVSAARAETPDNTETITSCRIVARIASSLG